MLVLLLTVVVLDSGTVLGLGMVELESVLDGVGETSLEELDVEVLGVGRSTDA